MRKKLSLLVAVLLTVSTLFVPFSAFSTSGLTPEAFVTSYNKSAIKETEALDFAGFRRVDTLDGKVVFKTYVNSLHKTQAEYQTYADGSLSSFGLVATLDLSTPSAQEEVAYFLKCSGHTAAASLPDDPTAGFRILMVSLDIMTALKNMGDSEELKLSHSEGGRTYDFGLFVVSMPVTVFVFKVAFSPNASNLTESTSNPAEGAANRPKPRATAVPENTSLSSDSRLLSIRKDIAIDKQVEILQEYIDSLSKDERAMWHKQLSIMIDGIDRSLPLRLEPILDLAFVAMRSGNLWHKSSNCRNLHGLTSVTKINRFEAIQRGFERCPICAK